jgi:hypothetical protein
MHRSWLAAALLALLAPLAAWAAGVQATLDRSTVQLGETVTLNLQVQGAGSSIEMPDLQALQKDFTILGTSQNRSVSVVNGHASSTMTIGVALRPNHIGTLTIPALDVSGEQTAPLQLTVDAPNPNAVVRARGDVFMQAQITPTHGYVGEQFSYVQRLYYAVNITSGTLDPPSVDGMDVRQLGNDLNYQAQRGGRDYQVLERRYALTPQQAGRIEIPATGFRGDSTNPMDPNSFFGSATPLAASAPAVSIEVQPPPASWGSADWLPARDLSLAIEGWPDAQHPVRVGQVVNLTMTMRATGLPAEALPVLSMPTIPGATVYPGRAEQSSKPEGQWLSGQRQRTFALVPNQGGTLTVPATTVQWWNVLTGRVEVAQVPAHRLTVLPALGSSGVAPPASATSALAAAPTAQGTRGEELTMADRAWPWRWLVLGLVALALVCAAAWWWRRHRRDMPAPVPVPAAPATPEAATPRQGRLRFLAAARGKDAALQAHTLLAWARADRPSVRSLGDLLDLLRDAAQREAVAGLQRQVYAGQPVAHGTMDLARVFKRGFAWKAVADADQGDGLAPLYPFKLH